MVYEISYKIAVLLTLYNRTRALHPIDVLPEAIRAPVLSASKVVL